MNNGTGKSLSFWESKKNIKIVKKKKKPVKRSEERKKFTIRSECFLSACCQTCTSLLFVYITNRKSIYFEKMENSKRCSKVCIEKMYCKYIQYTSSACILYMLNVNRWMENSAARTNRGKRWAREKRVRHFYFWIKYTVTRYTYKLLYWTCVCWARGRMARQSHM